MSGLHPQNVSNKQQEYALSNFFAFSDHPEQQTIVPYYADKSSKRQGKRILFLNDRLGKGFSDHD
jgi:hypothetical protein